IFGGGLNGDERKSGVEDGAGIELLEMNGEFSRFDGRDVEEIVDEAEEELAAAEDVAKDFLFFLGAGAEAVENEFGEAEDGIEGSAEVVGD
ncbi:hypothetical protein NL529_28620, partial [Klebsiella pneumoniae]|nr:hypothetical protein [Klebsiella pneumoniae]